VPRFAPRAVRLPGALAQPDFRSLWLAGLVSDAGDWMLLVALPIVVYSLTGSALGTSFAFLAELAPGVLLAPVAGKLADLVDRRSLMLAVTLLQAAALLPLLLVHGHSGLGLLYGVIVAQAVLSTFFDPAKTALLPTLLPAEELVSGNSLVALNNGLGRLAGGPLGGLLLAAGDLRAIVVADAVSFLVAAWLIARLPGTSARLPGTSARLPGTSARLPGTIARLPGTTPRPVRAPAAQSDAVPSPRGFLAALRGREIRLGLLVTFVADIAQGIFVVLFIVFVARRLHGGSGEIGLLRGIQAVGAIGAGLVLSFAGRSGSPARLIAGAALAFGLIDLAVWNAPALTTAVPVYIALFIVVGAPGIVMETGLISFLQVSSAEAERGRVFGALTLVSNAGQAAGMLAAGILAGPIGLMPMLNAQGCLYLAAGLLAMRALVPPRSANLGKWRTSISSVASRRPPYGRGRRRSNI
jgi:MFS family permease